MKNIFCTWVNDNGGAIPNPDIFEELLQEKLNQEAPKGKLHSFFPFYEDFIKRSQNGSRINHKSKQATVYSTKKGIFQHSAI